ncbi:uncharacterized protein [Dysidea avara]|uniref:uncharacterized protein isoform X3 n=1 Tax=Dysidea avara TaxID=196820 RepID=UPI0033200D14
MLKIKILNFSFYSTCSNNVLYCISLYQQEFGQKVLVLTTDFKRGKFLLIDYQKEAKELRELKVTTSLLEEDQTKLKRELASLKDTCQRQEAECQRQETELEQIKGQQDELVGQLQQAKDQLRIEQEKAHHLEDDKLMIKRHWTETEGVLARLRLQNEALQQQHDSTLSEYKKLERKYIYHGSCKSEASIVELASRQLALYNCLEINDCDITDQEAEELTTFLLTVQSIAGLDISNTNLTASKAIKIVKSLKKFSKIKFLRMHRNIIDDGFTDSIIAVIDNNDLLQELIISCNKLSTASIVHIASALAKMNAIKILDFSKNLVSSDGVDNLTTVLSKCNTLQELNISQNLLSFTSLLNIAKGLRCHPNLQILNMHQSSVNFSTETEFLVDVILSTSFLLTYLNVCGRNIRPRFIDDYLSPPPQKSQGSINRFVLHKLYISRYLLINDIASEDTISRVDIPVGYIKVTEECPLSKDDIISYYVDYNGGTFYNQNHDFAIVVPPNAVSFGDCVEIQATASQLGPYKLPDDYSPISSFYWVSAHYDFKIPVYLIMSHYAKFSNLEDINNVCVMQACVRDLELTSDGKQVMKEVPRDSYCFDYEIGYCAFATDHFCSICLRKKVQQISEHFVAMFYTYDINEVHFGEVAFCPANSDCMKTIKLQYNGKNGNLQHAVQFCYSQKEVLCISEDSLFYNGWHIDKYGKLEIVFKNFSYWEHPASVLADLEKIYAYPPRFQVRCRQIISSVHLNVSFTVCKRLQNERLLEIAKFVITTAVREAHQDSIAKITSTGVSNHSTVTHLSTELCIKAQYPVLSSIRRHLVLKWKFVGYSLQLKYYIIDNIEQRQTRIEDKTFEMLVEWRQTDTHPCYCKLISALNEHKLSGAVDDLKVNIKSEYLPSQSLSDDKDTTVNIGILNTVPEMGDLNYIVVPKIKAHWEDVAYALRFKIHDVQAIKEKYHEDPKKCCVQLFADWLSTNKGVTPKTWPTLLAKLKKVEELTEVVENIKAAIVTP